MLLLDWSTGDCIWDQATTTSLAIGVKRTNRDGHLLTNRWAKTFHNSTMLPFQFRECIWSGKRINGLEERLVIQPTPFLTKARLITCLRLSLLRFGSEDWAAAFQIAISDATLSIPCNQTGYKKNDHGTYSGRPVSWGWDHGCWLAGWLVGPGWFTDIWKKQTAGIHYPKK